LNLRYLSVPACLAVSAFAQTAPAPASSEPVAATAGAAPQAPAPANAPKVAVIQFQAAVLSTAEGKAASATLRTKFDPKKADVDKRQAQLQAMNEKLQKGGATLTPDARAKMQDDLGRGSRTLQRDIDDLNNELQQDEGKVMQEMGGKMSDLIQSYASKHGYSIVLDVSSEQTPVLWADAASNITADIVKEYDALHPVKSAAAASAISAPAGAPRPVK
jgi:outer membrane protein